MKWTTYEVEIITPCFCAGADQKKAEIRVPSIRGQLRWWFRALGGTREEETAVFGGVHGRAVTSKVWLRVSDVQHGPEIDLPKMRIGTSGAYIWYFAAVSGDKKRWWNTPPRKGQRGVVNPDGHLPPGTTFKLHIGFRKELTQNERNLFDHTLECFLRFGGIGMRLTRAMGALSCTKFNVSLQDFKHRADVLLKGKGFRVQWEKIYSDDWRQPVFEAETRLKEFRESHKAGRPSPLGGSSPRQTSAVYFRPVKLNDGTYTLLIFEAPHERVLAPPSRRAGHIL